MLFYFFTCPGTANLNELLANSGAILFIFYCPRKVKFEYFPSEHKSWSIWAHEFSISDLWEGVVLVTGQDMWSCVWERWEEIHRRFSGSHELCVCSWGFVGLSQLHLHFWRVRVAFGEYSFSCGLARSETHVKILARCSLAPVMGLFNQRHQTHL